MRIRSKLTFNFAIIVATILLIFSFAIYYFSADFREQEFDKRLIDKGLTTARLLIMVDEVDMKLLRIIDKNNLTAFQNEKITIYDYAYRKMYSSDDDPEVPVSPQQFAEIKSKQKIFFNYGENEAIGVMSNDEHGEFYVIVSAYDKFGLNKLRNLKIILTVGFFTSMLVVYLGGRIFSGQTLKPISDIVNRVKNISVKNLNSKLDEGNGQDELAQLAIQFNQMLGRLEQSFEIQKTFVSNASHELRTPLSIIRSQLEISLASERSKEEYRESVASVLEDIAGLIKLTNGLLDLAQTGSDMNISNLKKIRVDEVIYQCISEISKKYTTQTIHLNIEDTLEDEQLFIIMANEPLLKTALINILDNACKYSNNNSVMVTIGFQNKEIIVSVVDYGLGIRSAELLHVFDPFYRGSNSRNISGHGIGLSLTQRIISLHNGKVKLLSKVNEGTTAIIHLPSVS